jgi:hypothetical protein
VAQREIRLYMGFESQSLAPKYPGNNKDLGELRFGQVGRLRQTWKSVASNLRNAAQRNPAVAQT